MFPLFALLASAAISTVGSIAAGNAQKRAAKLSADAQVVSTEKNIAFQKEVYATQRADAEPWRQTGLRALADISAGMADGSFDMENFRLEADPGYKFRLDEGQKAMDRASSAGGNFLSGRRMQEAARYGQEMGSQEYGNAYNRARDEKMGKFNRLAGQAGVGQVATQNVAQAGANMGQSVGGAITAGGNAIAQGYRDAGAASANMYGNVAASLNTGISNYLTYRMVG